MRLTRPMQAARMVALEQQILAQVAQGPTPISGLTGGEAATSSRGRQIYRRVVALQAAGKLRHIGPRTVGAYWVLPTYRGPVPAHAPHPHFVPATAARARIHAVQQGRQARQAAAVSWWLGVPDGDFHAAAERRARERGWDD